MVAWTRMVMKVADSRNSQTRQAARLASFVVIGDKLQLTSRMLLRYTISFQQIVATLVIITKILSFIFSSLKKSCFETGIIFKFSKIATILWQYGNKIRSIKIARLELEFLCPLLGCGSIKSNSADLVEQLWLNSWRQKKEWDAPLISWHRFLASLLFVKSSMCVSTSRPLRVLSFMSGIFFTIIWYAFVCFLVLAQRV